MTLYHKLSDAELFSCLKKGDELAYTEIYKRFWAVLYRHARRMLQDEEEAEDVIQEVFTMLWNKASELQIKDSLSGFLYATVRNRIFDHMEHGKVKSKYMSSLGKFIEDGAYHTDYLIREKQLKELIEQEISALPEAMRVAFLLSRNANLSYKDIAEQMGVTENAVRNNISRALKILRQKFGSAVWIYLFFNSW
ncbi:RNA polymerase sigma-70 factor [Pedobacter sp. FW305-3-2-15-E-R2A2]|uniref:RNA polymerase sigma factor n=1 Tax=Pedobacter sp. FW305-3-2-15-E-R2A2 TaxID=3140251 RepID=UPI00314058F8